MVQRVMAALLALAVLSACTPSAADPVAADRPLVLVLRSVADPHHAAFLAQLRDQRFAVGPVIEVVPTDGEQTYADQDEVAAALADLDRTPTVVVAYSTPLATAAVDLLPGTPTITVVNDPIASGLVEDRERPEGWVTGVTFASPADRTLELTGRLLGEVDRVGYLAPADDPAVASHRAGIVAAAEDAGLEVVEATFGGDDDVAGAVASLVEEGVDAAVLASANATFAAYDALREAITGSGLPVISNNSRADFAVLTLEPDGAEVRRQVARQVARVLAGDPVAQIPVEDPRRFRLVIDRTIAATFGADDLDDGVLRQADEVR
ncbi:ABC transporter substrate binding protein [Nitriliruptor alkaliphilus]|uniref:ABC transporter substrate binding protein n=1 Tax=Nitriliruptor alkaliphilus TaxID=427918 RepID=UPI0012ECEDAB|nr:ABC transporter substrate binding protein [Nitriliruptor alkaliphilus]